MGRLCRHRGGVLCDRPAVMKDAAAMVGIAGSEYARWGRLAARMGLPVEVFLEEVAARVVVPRFRVRRA